MTTVDNPSPETAPETTDIKARLDEVRRRIDDMFPAQRKLELFARKRVPMWDCWGNEVNSDVTLTFNGSD